MSPPPPPPPLPPTPPPGDRWPRPPGCKIPPPITFASPPLGPVSPPLTPPPFPPLQPTAAAAVAGTKKQPSKPLPPPPSPPSSARDLRYWLEVHPYRLLSLHGSRFQHPNLAPIVIPKGGATGEGLGTDPWAFADDAGFVPWSRRSSRSPPLKKTGGSTGEGEDKEREGAAAAVEGSPQLQDPATQS